MKVKDHVEVISYAGLNCLQILSEKYITAQIEGV